jgi:hypothetical protein
VSEVESATVGDLDEARPAIRVGWPVEKNERYRHLHLPPHGLRRRRGSTFVDVRETVSTQRSPGIEAVVRGAAAASTSGEEINE